MATPQEIAWDTLDALKYADEEAEINALLAAAPLDARERAAIARDARDLVRAARAGKRRKGAMESFLEEFGLGEAEGLALMCLAEALLRVPDAETADKLIAEKIVSGDWASHLGRADSWLVNASTWGLMLTGRVIAVPDEARRDPAALFARLVARVGEPVVRAAAMQAMALLGEQFVLGRTIGDALRRGRALIRAGEARSFSFDMLGEGARTMADARAYAARYAEAIDAVSAEAAGAGPEAGPGVSVKLSALHPRYEARQEAAVMGELYPALLALARRARAGNIAFCLDAEEADRLVLSLELLGRLSAEPDLAGWNGLGLAVQAYQKRARVVIARVADLARARAMRLMVRLVKGAYWDGEIKRAQIAGRPDYPVFTTKAGTDLSYLACARDLIAAAPALYPQFATHNAHTALAVAAMAARAGVTAYEFQRLHGMGEALYAALNGRLQGRAGANVRVYAPVGGHEDLLPYLVRRLLENGANASFVHGFLDDDVSPDLVAADPIAALEAGPKRHPRVPKPGDLYPERRNSAGRDLSIRSEREALRRAVSALAGKAHAGVEAAGPEQVERALSAYAHWNARGPQARAQILNAMADALAAHADDLVALIAREAGRTLQDGIDEVREAVDFCRYYAAEAKRVMPARALPGPAGEDNTLELFGRGVFAAISPWNFPLSIFTGQIAAALAAGNTVVAKPAEQTPRIAAEAVRLFYEAGLPGDVLRLAQGDGAVGAALVADRRIAGVVFTGSTETAQKINRSLAARDGAIPVLIAETGGLNAMFIDTTALKEQVVDDAILSAFGSAGQRCSSLRLLFLPHETADEIVEMLAGAMAALVIGDPADPATDIGPIIDADAKAALDAHMARMRAEANVIAQRDVAALGGNFFGPALVELPDQALLRREVFGPILHIVRYDPAAIEAVGAALAGAGYGLTLGVHSRLESFARAVIAAVPAGNVYVNRSIIGAVVGVQPFGGLGLSGTGPKAGGPHYLPRFANERARAVNTAAQGGDPKLLNL
jgi:RHH-type proline utilization regulon transcriptional repressor/proline dehydrogenase/delta 1-pyrroline-5-carboxylate dehydrogenase